MLKNLAFNPRSQRWSFRVTRCQRSKTARSAFRRSKIEKNRNGAPFSNHPRCRLFGRGGASVRSSRANGRRPLVSLRGGPSVLLGDDRAVLERAGSHQAADGGLIDGEAPGEIGLRFALCDPLQPLGALMGRELARPAEADAALWARLRPSPVLARIRWRSNSAKPPRMVSRSARRSRWVTTRTSPVKRNQQPVQFQTARQCGARTKSGKPCRSPATKKRALSIARRRKR